MRIAMVGFGSVGRALAAMLPARTDALYGAMGLSPRLVAVVDSRGAAVSENGLDPRELLDIKASGASVAAAPVHGRALTGPGDAPGLIRDLHADVLIEASPSVLGDPTPALNNIKAAMSTRKHVVSVNKAPLALAMPALLELARFNGVQMRYSGTVGAGTPVLDTARRLARGDRITRVRAILNGTTNFILWKMGAEGAEYAAALAEAQTLGYAEADPSTDVDGIDTATKLVILANAVLAASRGRTAARVTMGDVAVEGIRGLSRARIDAAAEAGERVKLVGEADLADPARPALSVRPRGVAAHGPMDVAQNLNAVQFTLEHAGEVTLVGRGAGGPETATAIVRDLVDIWNTAGAHG